MMTYCLRPQQDCQDAMLAAGPQALEMQPRYQLLDAVRPLRIRRQQLAAKSRHALRSFVGLQRASTDASVAVEYGPPRQVGLRMFGFSSLGVIECGAPLNSPDLSALAEMAKHTRIFIDSRTAAAIARVMKDSATRVRFALWGVNRAMWLSWDNAATETWSALCTAVGTE